MQRRFDYWFTSALQAQVRVREHGNTSESSKQGQPKIQKQPSSDRLSTCLALV